MFSALHGIKNYSTRASIIFASIPTFRPVCKDVAIRYFRTQLECCCNWFNCMSIHCPTEYNATDSCILVSSYVPVHIGKSTVFATS